jgi:hypothetical protein
MIKEKKRFANDAGLWWLTPVVLATQEAEIRGSKLKASSGK